jgi:hypothetical protein
MNISMPIRPTSLPSNEFFHPGAEAAQIGWPARYLPSLTTKENPSPQPVGSCREAACTIRAVGSSTRQNAKNSKPAKYGV